MIHDNFILLVAATMAATVMSNLVMTNEALTKIKPDKLYMLTSTPIV